MKSLLVSTLSLILAAGCSTFQMHTNLDKENFTDYFKPSSVQILTKEQVLSLNALQLGTVEGESCQANDTQPVPSKTEAETISRRKAADLGGNAIVFGKCIEMPASSECKASVICYGQAYKTETTKQ